MPLAFHILAHRAPQQVQRLITAILRPQHLLVLHFDRRAPRELHELGHRLAAENANVILQKPRAVVWAGWQGLHTQLEAMELALRSKLPWSHFITLSGADFPLQSVEKTSAELAVKEGVSFVTSFDAIKVWKDGRARVEKHYIASPFLSRVISMPYVGRRFRRLMGWENSSLPFVHGIRRIYPKQWPYLGGINWCVLARTACAWITTDAEARAFARWVKHVAIPDEMYFQSVLCSNRFSGEIENRAAHFVDFPPGSINPTVLTMRDLPRLYSSGFPFARKFDLAVDSAVIEALEKRVLD